MSRFRLDRSELRLLALLLIGCVIGSAAIVPYAAAMSAEGPALSVSMVLLTALNALILYPLPIYIGILCKRTNGMAGAPLLQGGDASGFKAFAPKAVLLGALVGVLIVVLDVGFTRLDPVIATLKGNVPGRLEGFFASFYGGIVEEVLMRFFLVGVLARVMRPLGSVGIWASIVFAALVFGVGHLPAVVTMLGLEGISELSSILIARTLVLNGIAGLLFGWLYWRKGIELAMLAHFSADIALHAFLFPR